jgi:hypothetical protein
MDKNGKQSKLGFHRLNLCKDAGSADRLNTAAPEAPDDKAAMKLGLSFSLLENAESQQQ